MTETIVIEDFNIEDELLDHLGNPESAMSIYKDRFSPDFLNKGDGELKKLLAYVFDYIDEFRKAPPTEVLELEFGFEFEEPTSEVDWLVGKFRERYKKNRTKDVLISAARKSSGDPDEAAKLAIAELTQIQAATQSRKIALSSRDWSSHFAEYQRKVMEGHHVGYTYGWDEVDKYIGGLKQNALSFVIGRPKRFKSWMLLKSAVEVQGHPVNPGKPIVFTLELSKEDMMDRYMCMVAGVNYGHFKDGRLPPDEQKRMLAAGEEMDELPEEESIEIVHMPRGQRTVQIMRQYALDKGADVIYIDQLSFIESTRRAPVEQRHVEVGYVMEDLKDATHDFPVYVAAQFNREAASMDEMADLSKIGLSDTVGQMADTILGLYQSKDMRESHIVEFGVVEARNYGLHRWEIAVDFPHTNFHVESKREHA